MATDSCKPSALALKLTMALPSVKPRNSTELCSCIGQTMCSPVTRYGSRPDSSGYPELAAHLDDHGRVDTYPAAERHDGRLRHATTPFAWASDAEHVAFLMRLSYLQAACESE